MTRSIGRYLRHKTPLKDESGAAGKSVQYILWKTCLEASCIWEQHKDQIRGQGVEASMMVWVDERAPLMLWDFVTSWKCSCIGEVADANRTFGATVGTFALQRWSVAELLPRSAVSNRRSPLSYAH